MTVLEQIKRQAREAALDAVQARLQVAAIHLVAIGSGMTAVDLEEIRRLGIELRAIGRAMDALHADTAAPPP